jgi:hypothetical protein
MKTGLSARYAVILQVVRLIALLLGAASAWLARQSNNPGGISYLDIADAYMRGDFANAINGYWSPLYSLLLGPALVIFRPGPYYEASVAHLVNFLIYFAAMVTFDRFLQAVIHRSRGENGAWMPEWVWILFGYSAFVWSALILINVRYLSADLLMAVFVFGAAAILVRMQDGPVSLGQGALFGATLGLGYLSKAAMFPLSFMFFAAALVSRLEWRRNVPAVAAALTAFFLVISPFVVALSLQKGRPTFGDAGKLVYAWYVNDVIQYAHWQGEAPGRGVAVHPDRRIHEHPDVFEYATPIAGTHPIWYDPTYWHEGLEWHFDLKNQVRALIEAAKVYWDLALEASAPLLAICVLLSLGSRKDLFERLGRQWYLLGTGILPFAMFAVVHAETRFVGAFLVIVFLGLLLAVRLPSSEEARQFARALMVGASIVLGLRTTVPIVGEIVVSPTAVNVDYEIASGLIKMGLHANDRVGTLGWAFHFYWARLAHVRIVAEMPPIYPLRRSSLIQSIREPAPIISRFWSDTPEARRSVYNAFRKAGVRVIVTDSVPSTSAADGWLAVRPGGPYAYWLESASAR